MLVQAPHTPCRTPAFVFARCREVLTGKAPWEGYNPMQVGPPDSACHANSTPVGAQCMVVAHA